MIILKITKADCLQILLTIVLREAPQGQITTIPMEQQMEKCFRLFSLQHDGSALAGPRSWRAEGRRTAWLGWGSDRRSGCVVGQRWTQMLSGSVWRAVIVLQDCDLQSDNAVSPPSTGRPTGRYLTANRWWCKPRFKPLCSGLQFSRCKSNCENVLRDLMYL